jgi:mRNA-degrading endonuclease RelE of RelBE toxin-antitoxin system
VNWVCKFSANAEQDLRGAPKAIQKRVARVLSQMSSDPFQGNVKPLKGAEWKGVFRRRIGDYPADLSAIGQDLRLDESSERKSSLSDSA